MRALSVPDGPRLAYASSLLVAVLMAAASVGGLLFQSVVYPTAELRTTFVANDVANLTVGLPMLLGTMWLVRRGTPIGHLWWPGALFFVVYGYIVYALALPPGVMLAAAVLLVVVSASTMVGLVVTSDGRLLRQRLSGAISERLAGSVLVGFGALFLLRAIVLIAGAVITRRAISGTQLATLVADLVVSPVWIAGGLQLWRRRDFGYVSGAGLLFQASMLFIALVVLLLVQPLVAGTQPAWTDLAVVLVMASVFIVPLVLCARGVARSAAAGQAHAPRGRTAVADE
jgi:hypothetical protein